MGTNGCKFEDRDLSYRESAEPELSYVFTHAITQEVAYQSLLLAQRQQLHHAIVFHVDQPEWKFFYVPR